MHEPFKRIIPGAENAVLFVHGIVSTPRFFDDYAAVLPPDWSVHSLLLPGHGGSVKEFGRHSAKEWAAHVHAAVEKLRQTHRQIYIIAHSLGTLLAIHEAVQDDRNITGMLLLCVPLRIWAKPSALLYNALKGVGLVENTALLHTYYGVEQDWRVWRYILWIPRYLELFAWSKAARREVVWLNVPTAVYMARKDELVSLRGVKDMQGNAALSMRYLPDSGHHAFPPADKGTIRAALLRMCGIAEQEAP